MVKAIAPVFCSLFVYQNVMPSCSSSQQSDSAAPGYSNPSSTANNVEILMAHNAALEEQLKLYEEELTHLKQLQQELTRDRQQTDMTLQYQLAENRAILEALPDMMLRVRQDGFCLDFLPPIGESRDKYTPIHFHLSEVLPPDLLQRQLDTIQQALTTQTLQIYEHSFEKQGQLSHEEVRISAINEQEVLIIVRDISDRKQAENTLRQSETELRKQATQLSQLLKELQQTQMQLVQAEKMSSLSQLVAGIAHEINNPVGFIHGNLVYANRYTQDLTELVLLYQEHHQDPAVPVQERLAELDLEFLMSDLIKVFRSMETGVDRIQHIVQALRTFSHLDQTDAKAVDIHQGIDSVLTLLQGQLDKEGIPTIEVIKHYGELPLVECYVGELNQVFMHILSNAIDALHEKSTHPLTSSWIPQLTIRTQYIAVNQAIDGFEALLPPSSPRVASPYVQVDIIDNGMGMSDEAQHHVFDPFFTTKPVGQGLGMGLAISYQIITQKHQGAIAVQSAPNIGTTVTLQIPVQTLPSDDINTNCTT